MSVKPSLALVRPTDPPDTGTGAAAGPEPCRHTPPDHFVRRDGKEFAGTHLIVDLWEARLLDKLEHMEAALRRAVEAGGATLLHIHLHHFTPGGGISGVAVLAESHISVHTWPERGFAAFDIFMCGDARPQQCLPVLRAAFTPRQMTVRTCLRGETETHD